MPLASTARQASWQGLREKIIRVILKYAHRIEHVTARRELPPIDSGHCETQLPHELPDLRAAGRDAIEQRIANEIRAVLGRADQRAALAQHLLVLQQHRQL